MNDEEFVETRNVTRWIEGNRYRIKVNTIVNPAAVEFLKTSINTCLVPEHLFRWEMLDWPEVIAVQEAAEKLAARILKEIE